MAAWEDIKIISVKLIGLDTLVSQKARMTAPHFKSRSGQDGEGRRDRRGARQGSCWRLRFLMGTSFKAEEEGKRKVGQASGTLLEVWTNCL